MENQGLGSVVTTMNIAILTSVAIRHRFFVNRLGSVFNVQAVVYEDVGYSPATVDAKRLTESDQRIVTQHFEEREL